MPDEPEYSVRLESNGDYWLAAWKDPGTGKRRRKSLGPKSEMTERRARRKCKELEVDLDMGVVDGDRPIPRLSEWVEQYRRQRTDLDAKTDGIVEHTGRYLLAYFENDPPIDRITRADAADWRAALARGELRDKANVYPKKEVAKATRYHAYRKRLEERAKAPRPLSEATVAKHVRAAKRMFEEATDENGVGHLRGNPFRKLSGRAPKALKTWATITPAETERILAACPNDGWRCLFALARYAGLRRQEALDLRWGDVLFDQNKLQVNASIERETTKRARRVCPIEPDLCRTGLIKILQDAFAAAPAGAARPCEGVDVDNLDKAARRIVAAAGIPPYKKPFHALRKNRAGELAARYPQHVLTEWMGHDAEVAAEFYLRVEDSYYALTPLPQEVPQTGPGTSPTRS